MVAFGGKGGIAPTHSWPRHQMGVSGQCHAPVALCPGGKTPGAHCTGGWVGPRAGLDTEVRRKILFLCRGSNHDRRLVQSVVRHYTDWAIPAPLVPKKELCMLTILRAAMRICRDISGNLSIMWHYTSRNYGHILTTKLHCIYNIKIWVSVHIRRLLSSFFSTYFCTLSDKELRCNGFSHKWLTASRSAQQQIFI
jgi:hypothetical protein